MKNIILQHYNGKLGELEELSKDNISNYAATIKADYMLVSGKPFRDHLTDPCQKACIINEEWDAYDNVLMLDIDVFVRKGLTQNVFNVEGHGIHGRWQAKLKSKLENLKRITNKDPYWAGSIYKFNKEERKLLRSVMPDTDDWLNGYNKAYVFEDEGILAELASRAKFPTSYMDYAWNQCSYLPHPENAKMIHMRTKLSGVLDGTWENGGKRPKIENYYELKMRGIV